MSAVHRFWCWLWRRHHYRVIRLEGGDRLALQCWICGRRTEGWKLETNKPCGQSSTTH